MKRAFALLLGTSVVAVAVAACGGSSSNSSSTSGAASATTQSATATASSSAAAGGADTVSKLSISAPKSGALMFSTTTLTAKAGTVMITFTNQSSEGHNLTIEQGSDGSVLGATPTFSGGSRALTLHLKAGKYTYFCSVPGHRQAGMQGTLTVS
jgi:plastocyanin